MRIGVYVGSFNPVHIVHERIMNFLIENDIVDKVLVIATGEYWDKNDLVPLEKRIEMLKLLESENILVDTTLNNYEYTYQILDKLKNDKDELYLIIGGDNLPKFHLWKEVDKILENKVIVVERDNVDYSMYVDKFVKKENFIFVDMNNLLDVSSTCIRGFLKEGNIESVKNYLRADVLTYILENDLYL